MLNKKSITLLGILAILISLLAGNIPALETMDEVLEFLLKKPAGIEEITFQIDSTNSGPKCRSNIKATKGLNEITGLDPIQLQRMGFFGVNHNDVHIYSQNVDMKYCTPLGGKPAGETAKSEPSKSNNSSMVPFKTSDIWSLVVIFAAATILITTWMTTKRFQNERR